MPVPVFGSGSVLDEVGDGLAGARAELQQRAQLGAGDPGVADHGQELDLLAEQARLPGVVIIEEERGRRTSSYQFLDRAGLPKSATC
jgi:hypothetical protein